MDRRSISTENAPAALGPYSQAIVANGFVFFRSGTVGIDPQSGALREGVAEQTEQALLNLRAILEAAGSSLESPREDDDLLRQRRGLRHYQRGLRAPHARSSARSLGASNVGLPRGLLISIEAIAVQTASGGAT